MNPVGVGCRGIAKIRISLSVGLTNKLESEQSGKKAEKRSQREVGGAAIIDGELLCKVI